MNINPVNFKLILAIVIAIVGVIFSIVNFTLGKYITAKLMGNDLKHITADIDLLKKEEKDFKSELKKELHNIALSIRRIEKKQVKRDSICEERHSKK